MIRVPIKAAQLIAYEYQSDAAIILAIDFKADQVWLATYGQTKALCRNAGRLGESIIDALPRLNPPSGLRDAEIKRLRGALERIARMERSELCPGLRDEFYGHACAIAEEALA